jgi:hypothetical protein
VTARRCSENLAGRVDSEQEPGLLEALAHSRHPERQAAPRQPEGGARILVGTSHGERLHLAVGRVDGAAREHVSTAGKDEAQAASHHEHFEPACAVAHEHHGGRVPDGRRGHR